MASLKRRLDRLDGGRECEACKITPDTEFRINVTTARFDEAGNLIPPSSTKPRKCPECGKTLPTIRLRGLDEKSRGEIDPPGFARFGV